MGQSDKHDSLSALEHRHHCFHWKPNLQNPKVGVVEGVEKEGQMERNNVVSYSYGWHDRTRKDDSLK